MLRMLSLERHWSYFERMQNEGVETDEVTLVGVISAYAQLGAAKYANWVREDILLLPFY